MKPLLPKSAFVPDVLARLTHPSIVYPLTSSVSCKSALEPHETYEFVFGYERPEPTTPPVTETEPNAVP